MFLGRAVVRKIYLFIKNMIPDGVTGAEYRLIGGGGMAKSYLGTISMWMCKSNKCVNVAYNSTTVSKSPWFLLQGSPCLLIFLSAILFNAHNFKNLCNFTWNVRCYGSLIFIHFYHHNSQSTELLTQLLSESTNSPQIAFIFTFFQQFIKFIFH